MNMTKKNVLIWVFAAVALASIVAGLCFFFLANEKISASPKVELHQIDEKYVLHATYNANYDYEFVVEQRLDGSFKKIKTLKSKKNVLDLSENGVDIVPGQVYQFSARYVAQKGSSLGEFSFAPPWQAKIKMASVDYSSLKISQDLSNITWKPVAQADGYELKFVGDGFERTFSVETNFFDLGSVSAGDYRLFVRATSSSKFVEASDPGAGEKISVYKKNEITSTVVENNTLTICCLQKVGKFELFVDGQIKATLLAGESEFDGHLHKFVFKNFGSIMAGFAGGVVQIQACEDGRILASNMVQI